MSNKSLLLVDDEPSILKSLKRIFHREGYRVTTANGPEEALAILEQESFPVILSDYRMPHKTGGELLAAVKTLYPDSLGLILSGYADLESVITALNSGAVYKFLEKPWNESRLIDEIQNAFEHWQEKQNQLQKLAQTDELFVPSKAVLSVTNEAIVNTIESPTPDFFGIPNEQVAGCPIYEVLPYLSKTHFKELCKTDSRVLKIANGSQNETFTIKSKPTIDSCWNLLCEKINLSEISTEYIVINDLRYQLQNAGEITLIYFDVRQFRHFDESLGHLQAENLLQFITKTLTSHTPEDAVFGRLNGSEFVLSLPGKLSQSSVQGLVDNFLLTFEKPFSFKNRELMVRFQSGFSYSSDTECPENIIRKSRIAANQNENKNNNKCTAFNKSMEQKQDDLLSLQSELYHAITRNEFELYYQPKVSTDSGKIIGAEALIRWIHTHKGIVPPDHFIPLAELTGLIQPIGDWVLSTASKQGLIWQSQGLSKIMISVNISGRQLMEDNIVEKISQIIENSGFPAHNIELEITETFLIQDIERNISILKQIKELGVSIAIDDFGTGYSSLNYLTQLPIDTLKVDRSFVTDMDKGTDKQILVKNIITMSHDLGMQVVAEGVETEEQLCHLKMMKCDEIQGYYYSPPVTTEAFTHLLEKQSH